MKRTWLVLCLLALAATPAYAQDCLPELVSATGGGAPYSHEVDGAPAGFSQNWMSLGAKVYRDAWANPAAQIAVTIEGEIRWRTASGAACDPRDEQPAHQDTLPPVQDTVVVDVCPADWTCILPGTEPPPAPTMYVAGFALGDSTEWHEHGLHVAWEPMAADSFRVVGSRADGSDEWTEVVSGVDSVQHDLHYDTVTDMRACVSAFRHDLEGPEACDEFEWAPMARSATYIVTLTYDGSELRAELDHAQGAWDDVPDDNSQRAPGVVSVEFEIDGEYTFEQWYPYAASTELPPGEYVVSWTVTGDSPASGRMTVTVPFEGTRVGAVYGELSNIATATMPPP